jgi:cell division protein ZapA (FtsZ GTPase activity inhibitor)
MVTDESAEYTDRLANTLNERMQSLKAAKKTLSVQDAAAIISLECLDELVKNKQTEQNIRTQISAYVEDANDSRGELEKVKKENEQLKERIRQLESEIKLRMQFAGDDKAAEQIIGSAARTLGAPPKK